MKIIAHGIKSIEEAQKALKAGVDFLEIDVADRFFPPKLHIQHDGIKGKFGIGQDINQFLDPKLKNYLFLDIKHAKYSLGFIKRFIKFVKDKKLKMARVCGSEWGVLWAIHKHSGPQPFYTLNGKNSLKKFKQEYRKLLYRTVGVSVRYTLITKEYIRELRKLAKNIQIWAWTVNDPSEFRRLAKLGVDGIITDEWSKLTTDF